MDTNPSKYGRQLISCNNGIVVNHHPSHSSNNNSIFFLCRHARLSLQKAACSRRSHMPSKELQHLRNFEVFSSQSLPQHPLYPLKRGEKEISELEFYLPHVRNRISDLEAKYPFLSKSLKPLAICGHDLVAGPDDPGTREKSGKRSDNTITCCDKSSKRLDDTTQTALENTAGNEDREILKKLKKFRNMGPHRASSSSPAPVIPQGSRSLTPPLQPGWTRSSPRFYTLPGKKSSLDLNPSPYRSRSRSRSPLVLRSRPSSVPSNGIRKFGCSGLDKFNTRKFKSDSLQSSGIKKSTASESDGFRERIYMSIDRFNPLMRQGRTAFRSPNVAEYDKHTPNHTTFLQPDIGVVRLRSSYESYADELGFPPPHIPSCSLSSYGNDDEDDGWESWNNTATHDPTIMDEDKGITTSKPLIVKERDVPEDSGNESKDYEEEYESRRIKLMQNSKCRNHDHAYSLDRIISKAKSRIKKLVTPDVSSNLLNNGGKPTSPLSPHRNRMKSPFSRSKDHANRHQETDNYLENDLEADNVEEDREPDHNAEKNQETDKYVEKYNRADRHAERYQKADQHVEKHQNREPGIGTISRERYHALGSTLEHPQRIGEINNANNLIDHVTKNEVKVDHRSGMMSTQNLEETVKCLGSSDGEHEASLNDSHLHSVMEEKENLISLELSRNRPVEVSLMKMEATDYMSNGCLGANLKREILSKNGGAEGHTGAPLASSPQNPQASGCEAIWDSDSKVSSQSEEIQEDNVKFLPPNSLVAQEESICEIVSHCANRKAQCNESVTYVKDKEVAAARDVGNETGFEAPKGIKTQQIQCENEKTKSTKQKKKVKFIDSCKSSTEVVDGLVVIEHSNPSIHDGQIQQKDGDPSLNISFSSVRKDDEPLSTKPDHVRHLNKIEKEIEYLRNIKNNNEGDDDVDEKSKEHNQVHGKHQFTMSNESFESILKPILGPCGHDEVSKSAAVGSSSDLLIQEHIHSWLSRIEAELKNRIDEAVADSMKKIEASLKVDIENLEIQRMQEVIGNLKKEIKLNSHENKEEFRHVESKLEKISHFMDRTGERLHKVQEDGIQCQSRVDGMKKGTDELIDGIRLAMDKLNTQHGIALDMEKWNTQGVKECKEKISGLETMVEILNKQKMDMKNMLNRLEKSYEERRSDLEVWKEFKYEMQRGRNVLKCDVVLRNVVQSLVGSWVGQYDTESLRKLQDEIEKDSFKNEIELENRVQCLEKWWKEGKSDIEALKKLKDELEEGKIFLKSEATVAKEGTMSVEKVEVLSQIPLAAAEEDRPGVRCAKLHAQTDLEGSYVQKAEVTTEAEQVDRMEERIVEQAKNMAIQFQKEIESTYENLAQGEKETSTAKFPKGMEIRILELEKENKCTQAMEDGLIYEKEKSSFFLLEMMDMNAHIRKEQECALASASEAKKRIQEVVQNFEHESERFHEIRSKFEKDKDAIVILSEEISKSATKAKVVLHDMDELREKNIKLSEVLSEFTQIKLRNEATNHRYEEMYTKVASLEGSQQGLCCKIGEVKDRTEEIEKSVAQWFPKYDAAAKVLNEVENRLGNLEACGRDDDKRLLEKDPFLSLYKDLSTFRHPNEPTRWSTLQYRRNLSGLDTREQVPFLILESRIEHVASAAYTNFRILDMKFEHTSRNLEKTRQCATSTEKKCNLLAAEIVKVFRMLANASKTNGGKLHSSPLRSTHTAKTDLYPVRRKFPLSTARFNQRKHIIPLGETKYVSLRGVKICEKNDNGFNAKGRAAKKSGLCGKNTLSNGNNVTMKKGSNVVHCKV